MNVKFQAEMKELDEKFAAISEDAKRRYDRHRFIRRAVMVFWAALVFMFYVDDEPAYYVYSCVTSRDTRPSSLNLYLVFYFMEIILAVCITFCYLKISKAKRYSFLFIEDCERSLIGFRIENFASLALVLSPPLFLLAATLTENSGIAFGLFMFIYGFAVVPICLLIFMMCYLRNRSVYTPKQDAANLAMGRVKFKEGDPDAKFANIPKNFKNRYDAHRLVRRATAALFAFLFIVSWFMDFVWTLRGIVFLVFLFVATLLLICLIKIYQSGNREKKYSKLFIKNQRLSLAIFAVENLALCPIIVLWIASIARNKVNMSSLLVDNFGVFLVCLLVFAACYFLNQSRYALKNEA